MDGGLAQGAIQKVVGAVWSSVATRQLQLEKDLFSCKNWTLNNKDFVVLLSVRLKNRKCNFFFFSRRGNTMKPLSRRFWSYDTALLLISKEERHHSVPIIFSPHSEDSPYYTFLYSIKPFELQTIIGKSDGRPLTWMKLDMSPLPPIAGILEFFQRQRCHLKAASMQQQPGITSFTNGHLPSDKQSTVQPSIPIMFNLILKANNYLMPN